MNSRKIYIICFLCIIMIAGCNDFTDKESALVTINAEKIIKEENILMKESDEDELGFKPEYKIEITPDSSLVTQFTLLGEQLDYLKVENKDAHFKLTIDVDSNQGKQFKLMIWDGEEFIKFKKSDYLGKYYDMELPKGKSYLELDNKINLLDDSPLTELSFLVHDREFPADIDYHYSPIRMYVTDKRDLLEIPMDKDERYEEDYSLLQSKSSPNESEIPQITFLNEDKKALKDKHLTDKTKFVSINQLNYNIKENIVFYDTDGYIYESYFIMHPEDQQAILPIPKEIKENIGEKDFFMLINNNYGQAGLDEIHKINKMEETPYLNHSFSYKLGSKH